MVIDAFVKDGNKEVLLIYIVAAPALKHQKELGGGDLDLDHTRWDT